MAGTVKWMISPAHITRETYVLVRVYVCILGFGFWFVLFSKAYIHDVAEKNYVGLSSTRTVCAELVCEMS